MRKDARLLCLFNCKRINCVNEIFFNPLFVFSVLGFLYILETLHHEKEGIQVLVSNPQWNSA